MCPCHTCYFKKNHVGNLTQCFGKDLNDREPSNSADWGYFNLVAIITQQCRISFYIRKKIYVIIWGGGGGRL